MRFVDKLRQIKGTVGDIIKGKYKNLFQIRTGFYDYTVKVCGIDKTNYKNFISDRDYYNGHPWNSPYSGIIDNKLFLPYLLHSYKDFLPKTLYFKDKCGFLALTDDTVSVSSPRVTIEIFLDELKRSGKFALKHTHSAIGKGFHLVSFKDGAFSLDNKEISENDLVSFINGLNCYIVQEAIEQADYSSAINSSSVNTIRLLCVWNSERNSFEVVRAFHRFGAKGQLVDNLGQGNGILVYLDPLSGELKDSGVVNKDGSPTIITGDILRHPDTDYILTGMKIPGYQEMVSKILDISNSISFLRIIGWDVVMTNDGFKIIETNSLTTLPTIQQREGFLSVPWLYTFFKSKS